MCMGFFFFAACTSVLCVCRPCGGWKEGNRLPGTRVTDGSKVPGGCWDSNPGPLEEQPSALNCGDMSLIPNKFF